MTLPNLGLNAAVLTAIRYSPTHSVNPIVDLWRQLTRDLTEEEAQQLPQSLRYVFPLISSDNERRRLLTTLAVSLDLYEVLPSLLEVAIETNDGEILLHAASLARHPGVESSWPNQIRRAVERLDLSKAQRRALEIRLNPSQEAGGALETRLRFDLWPGLEVNGGPPVVAFDDLNAPAHSRWRLAARLLEAGAAIRRLPVVWRQSVPPEWLSSRSAVVSWSDGTLHRLREAGLNVDAFQLILANQLRNQPSRILAETNRLLGGRLRTRETLPEQPLLISDWDPKVIRLGALDSRDMAYLSGATRSVVYRLAREEVLRPRPTRNRDFWSFGQLVALRTWRYFQSISGKRVYPSSLLKRLELLAQASTPTQVGVTSDGRVLQRSNGEFHDIESGQEVIEGVVTLDQIFKPFRIGGREAPMLPRPSRHTLVNPTVFGGTPALATLRLPVRNVMSVYRKHNRFVVQAAYPEITSELLQECLDIGSIIEALG